ncbi:hypothetical protein BH10ACT1_BH10ACT1_39180 [soil metagenome]
MTSVDGTIEPGVAIPDAFTGGWHRVSIALDGGPAHERSEVWWLQTPTRYADVRVPLTEGTDPDSFAGSCTWDEPALTWSHDLDLRGWATSDTGRARWEGDLLIEEGDGYVEVWERIPGSVGPAVALGRDHPSAGAAVLVRTGDVCLTLEDARPLGGRYRAVARRRDGERWTVALELPPGAADPDARMAGESVLPEPPPLDGLAVGDVVELADGLRWTVEELRP